ncbi:PD-(D/E)XK nuclease family protein [Neobacillus citreus]|uniref:PD-(D/E)XK nuclease family protein n=1 Tax=Neobacillus citreus TaxID=2833578 RepID=A0A942T792_9BACI|nr:PD-(D/E)XK nuclease family protein [Neobacillus citreus]MCH6269361.1 PD-(D/E)XK nuclease family protein [Neobacillus citreus]
MNKSNIFLEYKDIIEKATRFKQAKREKTVFSIGGRGHYENPISDVLAFFIDSREEHGFGTLLLSSIINLLNISNEITNLDAEFIEVVEREAITANGNRIDLVIAGSDWVLVIENKIYHYLNNPLNDYESYINTRYPDKTPYYAILSINEIYGVPAPWKNILYHDLIFEVKKNAGPYMFNSTNGKWLFFLHDFLLNLEEVIGEYKVDQKMIDFVQENYSKILNLIEVRDNYITSIKKQFTAVINEVSVTEVIEKIHNWSPRVAIRFYCPDVWGKETNLVLVLLPDGKFKIYYYVYGIEKSKQEFENTKLLYRGYQDWKEGKETILCYKSELTYDLNGAKEEFKLIVQHLNNYFKNLE